MSETPLMHRVQVELSKAGARVFRNQTGKYKLEDGRWLASGLCDGASDLIGWNTVIVTPDMVGKPVAIFTAVEVKTPGAKTPAKRLEQQQNFITAVRGAGGIAFFTSYEAEAVAALERMNRG